MTLEQFGTLVLGAPERLTNAQLPEEIQQEIQSGNRVILVGMTKDTITTDGPLTGVVPLKSNSCNYRLRPLYAKSTPKSNL